MRWRYFGLVNEPCFEKAKGPDEYGLWLDKRVPASAECPADPFENETKYPGVKTGARGTTVPVGSYYGKASGIVGLRLFPNPAFDDAAKKKWDEAKRNGDATQYYTDPDFFNDKDLIRPYRVGMSCGFCHVGPNPSNPPADPENPEMGEPELEPRLAVFLVRPHLLLEPEGAQENSSSSCCNVASGHARYLVRLHRQHQQSAHHERDVQRAARGLKAAKKWPEQLAGGELDNKQFNDFAQTKVLSEFYDPATRAC